jgi:hypothetical protein
MKKILLSLMVFGSVLTASAQDSTTKTTTTTTTTTAPHKYSYYPSNDVYFDQSTGSYWYHDKGSTTWMMTKTLPSTIMVEKTSPQFPINYTGDDPWKNNTTDVKKYKIKKNGTVKVKMKDKDD